MSSNATLANELKTKINIYIYIFTNKKFISNVQHK